MGRRIYNTSPAALLINLQLQTATPRSLVVSLHSLVDRAGQVRTSATHKEEPQDPCGPPVLCYWSRPSAQASHGREQHDYLQLDICLYRMQAYICDVRSSSLSTCTCPLPPWVIGLLLRN